CREKQHTPVETNFISKRDSQRALEFQESALRPNREQYPEAGSYHREQHTFGEQLPQNAVAGCAQRQSYRNLLAPSCRASQQQTADVGHRNQKYKRYRSEK